jgi:phage regulator Rha-like protein
MLDRDLAELYGVETKNLKRAVKRNYKRFSDDFYFSLSNHEVRDLRCQIGTSSWGGSRYMPFAFTEHGILMLSSVLCSERAVEVNIQIMRTFTKLREMLMTNEMLRLKIEGMECKYDHQFKIIFDAIRKLLDDPIKPKRRIGFGVRDEE